MSKNNNNFNQSTLRELYNLYHAQPNDIFSDILEKHNISYQREFKLDKYSYDFIIGNKLIEINPFSTHSTTSRIGNLKHLDKYYHRNKSRIAVENGYRCICVWDWDRLDKIISILNNDYAYARKCEIVELKEKDTKLFLNRYNLYGYCKSDIRVGLIYNNKVVSVLTIGKSRQNKTYQYEIYRYCSSLNVIGGVEKIFQYINKEYSPKSIISYCDLDKFTGNAYKKLGFTYRNERVHRHWYNPQSQLHLTEEFVKNNNISKYLNIHNTQLNNQEILLANGFVEIYDCGKSTYVYQNK